MKKREIENGPVDLVVEVEEGDLPESAYTHRLPVGKRSQGWTRGPEIQISAEAVEILGRHGKMTAHSKFAYTLEHPDNEVYFNACIFEVPETPSGLIGRLRSRLAHRSNPATDALEIWFGDLDLDLEGDKLQQLADRIGAIAVTPEDPYRADGLPYRFEDDPEVRVFRPRG